jgi:hypothetical protein
MTIVTNTCTTNTTVTTKGATTMFIRKLSNIQAKADNTLKNSTCIILGEELLDIKKIGSIDGKMELWAIYGTAVSSVRPYIECQFIERLKCVSSVIDWKIKQVENDVHLTVYLKDQTMNNLTLNYMWSILTEDCLRREFGIENTKERLAILNIIDDMNQYIDEQWYLTQAEDHACGGIHYELGAPWAEDDGIADQIRVWEHSFRREMEDKELDVELYNWIEDNREVLPF